MAPLRLPDSSPANRVPGTLWAGAAQNRDFGLDPRRMISINVMLNKSDQTDFLKLARHGLEVAVAPTLRRAATWRTDPGAHAATGAPVGLLSVPAPGPQRRRHV